MRRQSLRGSSLATLACVLAGSLALSACATMGGGGDTPAADDSPDEAREPLARGLDVADVPDPFPSTYRGLPRENMAIVGGTVFTGAGQRIENGVVIVTDGKVAAVGNASTPVPAGYRVVDARGRSTELDAPPPRRPRRDGRGGGPGGGGGGGGGRGRGGQGRGGQGGGQGGPQGQGAR